MGVVLRFARFGRKHLPVYRVVAVDRRSPRDGRAIEYLGTYFPIPDRAHLKHVLLKTDRIKYWLAVGAQPSDAVARLLERLDMWPRLPRAAAAQVGLLRTGQHCVARRRDEPAGAAADGDAGGHETEAPAAGAH